MSPGINHTANWNALVGAYLALSAFSLLLSRFRLPDLATPFLYAVLGPTAWLVWGFGMAPVFIIATIVFTACVIGATFLDARSRRFGRVALVALTFIWLLLGLSAYGFSV